MIGPELECSTVPVRVNCGEKEVAEVSRGAIFE